MRGGTPLPRLLVLFAVSALGFAGIGAPAARAAVLNRVSATITDGDSVEIPNSVHPKVALATDLGPATADTKLRGMSLRFSMTADQQAALDQLLTDLQDPASPRYHQWLTPAQYAAQFGLSSADLDKVKAWLTAEGFTVTGVANGGSFITFDGTVAQAQTAFSTSIHNLSLGGTPHFANVTNASVPAALSNVVGAISGLHDFRLLPRVRTSAASPEFTSSISGSHYLAPGDIYTIYDVNPLLTGGITGAGIGTGANCHSVAPTGGVHQLSCADIAVMGQVDISLSDVAAFRAASGLSTNVPTVGIGGITDPGSPTCQTNNCSPNNNDLAESQIDVEWAGAMAPSASLLFVTGIDVVNNSLTQAIDQNVAPIVTLSYGNCEAAWGSTELNVLNQLFKQANAQGQTVTSAAGDVGAADCDAGTSAIEGLAVDFPASSPYVTGLGGTQFSSSSSYWNSNSSSSTANAGSALSYIPETVWNENSTGNTFSSGGGGISAFFTKPAWQVETGPAGMTTSVKPDFSRDVPDLALDAAAGGSDTPYLYCSQGWCTSGFRNANTNLLVGGGTSFDSQIFGGMLALIEQKIGSRIGNANPTLYALGNSSAYYNGTGQSVYHDITGGNNSDPCTAGKPNCPNGGTLGYTAAVGYDLASGWGSVDLNNLANDWKLVTPLSAGSLTTANSATALTASTTSPTAGTNVTLTATVSGATGTPTGTVQFLVNNVTAGSPVTLVNGVATYTYATSCSSLGQQMMSAAYSGDATYSGSKGPALATGEAGNAGGAGFDANGGVIVTPLIVTVTSGSCPDFSLTPSGTGLTVSGSNASVTVQTGSTVPSVTITVAPINGFTGTVNFTATATTTTAYTPTLTFTPTAVTISSSSSATTTLAFTGITADLRMPKMPGHAAPNRIPWYAGSGVTVASLLLFMLPRRRRLSGLLVLVLAVALVGGASGCGSSSQAAPPAVNPYVGTYVVTIVGTYTSGGQTTSHNSTVTYTIN